MTEPATRTVIIHPVPAKRQQLRGCAAIAAFIGVSRRQVHTYVAKEGLPAWSEKGRGSPLLAVREEVVAWMKARRERATNA